MPLYRTVSDRGLWKKYQRNSVQHFHKATYLADKDAPQVVYSQLDLGPGVRSYNNRQSNPNIRKDIEAANAKLWTEEQRQTRGSRRGFKSAPGSRAVTPTRFRQRDRVSVIGGGTATDRPKTANSEYSQETFNDEDDVDDDIDRLSFESRSLTAFSNFSGRDSVLDSASNYNGFSASHLAPSNNMLQVDNMDRDNPFKKDSSLSKETEPVVRAFMTSYGHQEQNHNEAIYQNAFTSSSVTSSVQRTTTNHYVNSRYTDSLPSSAISNAQQQQQQQGLQHQEHLYSNGNVPAENNNRPGRIEDLPSPTGPISATRTDQLESAVSPSSTSTRSTREVISQLRRNFLNNTGPANSEQQQQQKSRTPSPEKKTNKYLRPENRWSKPAQKPSVEGADSPQRTTTVHVPIAIGEADGLPSTVPPSIASSSLQRSTAPSTLGSSSLPRAGTVEPHINGHYQNVPVVSDTVSKYDAPQMHHAERVNLRQDSSTSEETESSSTDSEEERVRVPDSPNPPANIVLQSPLAPLPSSVTGKPPSDSLSRHQKPLPPPGHQPQIQTVQPLRQAPTGTQRPTTSPPDPPAISIPVQKTDPPIKQRARSSSSSSSSSSGNLSKFSSSPERKFQDPAKLPYEEETSPGDSKKKKGFFGLFRKTKDDKKKDKKANQQRPAAGINTYKDRDNASISSRSSSEGRIPQFIPPPQTVPNKEQSPGGKFSMMDPEAFETRPLERKRSMSRPTDLDEIMKRHEEEDRDQQQQHQQERSPRSRDKKKNKNQSPAHAKAHDTTQEIDIDAIMGYDKASSLSSRSSSQHSQVDLQRIEWPKGAKSPTKKEPLSEPIEMPPPIEIATDDKKKKKKEKPSFFNRNFLRASKSSGDRRDRRGSRSASPPSSPEKARPVPIHVEPVIDVVQRSNSKDSHASVEESVVKPIPMPIATSEKKKSKKSSSESFPPPPPEEELNKHHFWNRRKKSSTTSRTSSPPSRQHSPHQLKPDDRQRDRSSSAESHNRKRKESHKEDKKKKSKNSGKKSSPRDGSKGEWWDHEPRSRSPSSSSSSDRLKEVSDFGKSFKKGKKSRPQPEGFQIGSQPPVDVSHLIDDDELENLKQEEAKRQNQVKKHDRKRLSSESPERVGPPELPIREEFPHEEYDDAKKERSRKGLRGFFGFGSKKRSKSVDSRRGGNVPPLSLPSEEPPYQPDDRPQSPPGRGREDDRRSFTSVSRDEGLTDTDKSSRHEGSYVVRTPPRDRSPSPMRGRPEYGSMSLGKKPPKTGLWNTFTRQGHQPRHAPPQDEYYQRDRSPSPEAHYPQRNVPRSSSMPRLRQKSGTGFGLFGGNRAPPPRRAPSPRGYRDGPPEDYGDRGSEMMDNRSVRPPMHESSLSLQRRGRPPPAFGLFGGRNAPRPRGPPPSRYNDYPDARQMSARPPMHNSVQSLSRGGGRPPPAFGLFGGRKAPPVRRQGPPGPDFRDGGGRPPQQQRPPRSTGFGLFGGRNTMGRPPPSRPYQQGPRPSTGYPPEEYDDFDKQRPGRSESPPLDLEPAPESRHEPAQTSMENNTPGRQMGRRTGHFRKTPSGSNLGRPPVHPGDPVTSDAQRPRSDSSSSDTSERRGDAALGKSTTSLGRSDSYKRAKSVDPLAAPPRRGRYTHSSMPRLNKHGSKGALQSDGDKTDEGTNSLGRRRAQSQSGAKGEDPCKVM